MGAPASKAPPNLPARHDGCFSLVRAQMSAQSIRPPRTYLALLAAAGVLGVHLFASTDAHADPSRSQTAAERQHPSSKWARWDREVTLWGHLLGSPFGVLGTSLDYSPIRYLALEFGVGISFVGQQAGAWPRVRLPILQSLAISAGPLLLVGDLELGSSEERRTWQPALIGGAAGGLEGRGEGGFSWRCFLGGGDVLNRDEVACPRSVSDCSAGDTAHPYFGVAFGYAFE